MRANTKTWVLLVAALFLLAAPFMVRSGEAAPPGITVARYPEVVIGGRYDVFGKNPNGSLYDGVVTIVEANGRFVFDWVISNGTLFHGTGRFEGERIVIHWGAQYPVIYEVQANGVLRGVWAGGTATETLVRQ